MASSSASNGAGAPAVARAVSLITHNGFSLVGWIGISQALALIAYHAFASVVRARPETPPVNRQTCDCACFDTKFKNGYDADGYKSIYFNLDETTPWLISWTVLYFVLAVVAFRTLLDTLLSGRMRWPLFALFLGTICERHRRRWCAPVDDGRLARCDHALVRLLRV